MLDTYLAADMFVMPSTAEAFGMMAIESMAFAKPVSCFPALLSGDFERSECWIAGTHGRC